MCHKNIRTIAQNRVRNNIHNESDTKQKKRIIQRYKNENTILLKEQTSLLKLLNGRDNRFILVLKPFIGILDAMDITAEYPEKKPWFSTKNIITRVFCDKSKFNIFGPDGYQMVWRKAIEEIKKQPLWPTVKNGGGSVLVWGTSSENMDILNSFKLYQDNDPKQNLYCSRIPFVQVSESP
ncbi:uncharacterized protein [Euwallacea similis]|uniref:uncharacterized protein n=1 Tax=Euwallacea similis TaxID=1736056 RepID=UPI00344C0A05